MWENLLMSISEVVALTLFLIMLHWLRRGLGILPMYLLLGMFFIFAQISQLPMLSLVTDDTGSVGSITHSLLHLPIVAMFLIVYEDEGTFEAQRLIFGLLVAVLGFLYITQLVVGQFSFERDSPLPGIIQMVMDASLFSRPLLCMTAAHLGILMLIPIGYQAMRNLRIPVFLCVSVHILLFCTGSILFQWIFVPIQLRGIHIAVWVSWFALILILSVIAQAYLHLVGRGSYENRKPLGILSTLKDHLQTASRLRQSVEEWAERYQAVLDNSQELIFLLNREGGVINANRPAVAILDKQLYQPGFTLPQLIQDDQGNPFNWEQLWNELWLSGREQAFKSISELHLKLSDERILDIELNLSTARLNEDSMILMIMRDMTFQHQETERRKALEEQLMHSQRMEAVGVLAGGIAHDFNNLLLGIQASAEVLSKQELTAPGRAMLGNIDSASHRAAELINKLLGFARKGKYQEELLDLASIAQKTADLFKPGLKDVDFRFLVSPEPLMVKGDETQLQQVILNLLLNAKDALLPGTEQPRKITLRLDKARADMRQWEKRPKNITVRAEDYITLRVKDTGKGMSLETQKHIFDPFFTTKGPRGTGLGLAMVYGCVQHHQGWTCVESQEGAGTEFTIFLPAAPSTGQDWQF